MFREFLVQSLSAHTTGDFTSLLEAGRLDVVYQCILTSIFKSRSHRHDVVFHAILNGPPRPPMHLSISGDELRDARVDERSWENILRNVLNGRSHEGVNLTKSSLQGVIKEKSTEGYSIFLLDMEGEPFDPGDLSENNFFVLGDHIGIPRKDSKFVLRYGKRVSLGKEEYLAATTIDIVNYLIDRRPD
ncbi:MAG: hypothetical protein M1162_01275 [Candidatus Thermoplasmatota archaeon]|nr:hypothetical protein [Candidatus Thermoplasmatota archaeon]